MAWCLSLVLLAAMPLWADDTGPPTIEVGVAWQGQSEMSERVLAGVQGALNEHAPWIKLEIRKELVDLAALEAAITNFEGRKQAMVILRSNGTQLLGRRGVAIPAFIGGTGNPVALGAAESLARPKTNITGVTYSVPAQLKLEAFRQVYPAMAKYTLLVEEGHPSGLIDAQETARAAAAMALSGRTVFCSTLDEAVAAIREAEPDEVIILSIQALLMDNASALVTAGERVVFSHSEQAVEHGALAGIVIDDYKLGQMLGMMLIDHLIHGKPISEMPILNDPEPRLRINHSTLERFRNRIPFTIRSLSQAEQILASIHKSAPTGIGMVKHRVLVQVNDYILDLTGYRREELLGKSARMLYPTQEESDFVGEEKYRQILEKGTGSVETRWLQKDGSIRHVILSSTPLDPSDLSLGVTFTVLDITDRKRAEADLVSRTRWFIGGMTLFTMVLLVLVMRLLTSLQQRKIAMAALRQSEENLATLFASMSEMVVLHELVFDGAGEVVNYRIIDVNGAFIRCTGISREKAVGRLATDVYGTKEPPYLHEFSRVALTGEPYTCTTWFEPMEKHFAISVVSPRRNRFATVTTDITDRKQAEAALQTSLAEKAVLLREVHHRVKNNMAAIVGLFNLQCKAMTDQQARSLLTELSSRVQAMSLVHEKLYRSESLAKIDFQDYLQSLISSLRISFGFPDLRCEIKAHGVEMPLDLAVPCGMIINELVTNALKYAFPRERPATASREDYLQITMMHDNNIFTLSVADNGVGLPPDFDLNTTKTLGLTLVRMLGEHQLGGRFELDRVGGTRLTLRFSHRNGRKAYG